MAATVLISAFPPFNTLSVAAPAETSLKDLYGLLEERYPQLPSNNSNNLDLVLSPHSGPIPPVDTPLSSLLGDGSETLVSLRLIPRVRGGKGGFGSQLRAAGGRMSSQKTSNNDSCRDLSGRRLSTIKEAKKLADYIESEPARKKAQQEAQRAKLEALEKKLGMNKDGNGEPSAGKKHRLEDTEYLEQSRDLVDNVKSAVSVAMLKKKKKAKTNDSPPTEESKTSTPNASSATAAAEKALDSPASAAPVAPTAVASA